VPRLGITGHVNLTEASVPLVYAALSAELARYGTEFSGISCLARGADTIFAQAVLDRGGRLDVLVPAADYRAAKVTPDHAPQYDAIVAHASTVRVLPHRRSTRAAYEAANRAMVACTDLVFAVWDGHYDAGRGNTSSTVEYARSRGVHVVVVWPDGVARETATTGPGHHSGRAPA